MFDSLGNRMKTYENVSRIYLPKRLPIIIRIDGRAFHTLTRGFARPFDQMLSASMEETAIALCNQIGGTKLAYAQSDEISLLLTNDDTIDTEPWFGNNLQKLVSISASIATLAFNSVFRREYDAYSQAIQAEIFASDDLNKMPHCEEEIKIIDAYQKALMKAQFSVRTEIDMKEGTEEDIIRNRWVSDLEIPLFTQDRNYIESRFRRKNV